MKQRIMALILSGLVGVIAANAGSFITDIETWSALGTWQQEDVLGGPGSGNADIFGVGTPGFSGPTDSSLQVGYAGTLSPPVVTDRIFTDGGAFVGDYTLGTRPSTFVGFDFYASEALGAGGLQLYFTSTTDGRTWYYTFNNLQVGTWQSLYAPLFESSWDSFGTPTTDFATALEGIDEIGFRLTYLTDLPGGQSYFFDNFRRGYSVPEPGTYAALGFALSSLGLTFRRRLNSVTDRIKAMFKA